ncbi:RNA polymerase sigma factor [Alistipes shahii]|jgi:RNA polymerase sigma-70 factor (family 1)|uniref:RNA polymerase sigma factor n=1 Tax=Alistipes shahii TaxID=328814 RepID=UPI0026707925|nr:sigma-70 family RNA polymerase sigma factor [Alistipes shahii]
MKLRSMHNKTIKLPESDGISALKKGSYEAFSIIYEYNVRSLYAFVISRVKDRQEAEDIVQETFIKLWNMRSRLDETKDIRSLLFTITRNRVVDTLRYQMNRAVTKDCLSYINEVDKDAASSKIYYDDYIRMVDRVKGCLTKRELEIYEMSREGDMSIREISQSLNIAPQTVKNILTSALRKIRGKLPKFSFL